MYTFLFQSSDSQDLNQTLIKMHPIFFPSHFCNFKKWYNMYTNYLIVHDI